MTLRQLGETGLSVSPIGLGLAALGRPGYINLGHAQDLSQNYDIAAMEAQTHKVLSLAWEKGIRYVDAARSYGRSEEFLAIWLESNPQKLVTVGSKWGYTYTANWQVNAEAHEIKEHSLPNLNKQWQESQALLGNHLNLYQIHSATLETGVLSNDAVLNRLAELKDHGTKIGLSLSGTGQADTLEQALRIKVYGDRLFDTVQATFNILEPSIGASLKIARAEGMGVIIKEALANGRLTTRNVHARFAEKRQQIKQQATRFSKTIDALALAFVLHQPWVDVVLSGAATEEHLRSNLVALELELDEEALDVLDSLAEPREGVLGDSSWFSLELNLL